MSGSLMFARLLRQGVTITTLTALVAVPPGGVRLAHVLTDEEWDIAADTVISSSGGVARDGLFHELAALESAPPLHLIGDAFAPRHLRHAMVDGARAGRAV